MEQQRPHRCALGYAETSWQSGFGQSNSSKSSAQAEELPAGSSGRRFIPSFGLVSSRRRKLLDAIKHVFPFAKDHKSASDLTVALELLFIDAQYEWEKIYAGKMSDEDIMSARRKMQKLRLEAERKRECPKFCVRGRVDHHAVTNLSSNMMANWVFASHHSRGGIFHSPATLRKTRYSSFIAASSVGKCPLVRTARRSFAFKDTKALSCR